MEKNGTTPSPSILSLAHRQSGGFSLLEVMIALAVLGVAIVSLFQLFSISLRSAKKAEDYTKALFYARSLFDEAYSVSRSDEIPGVFTFDDDYRGRREIAVRSADKDDKVRLYEITVTVTMPSGGGLTLKGLRTIYDEKK